MNNKKEQERNELHKTIWRIANDLRGSVDGWDFKQYVLGLLFYRFISENLTNYINEKEKQAGNNNFDYSQLSDEEAEYGREALIEDKGFYILPSQLFKNLQKRAEKDQDLNITLKNIFNSIENSAKGHDSEEDVKGLFDDLDLRSNKLGNTVIERNKKLAKIINAIGDLQLGNYKDNTIDLFGDAYEYLMTMYASNAGKSGGEFFTPQEVGELLAKIVIMDKKEVNKVYDPCCGSGGLLLKFAKVLGDKNIKQGYFGQEINITTYNLARINMFLHDINYNKFNLALGDTLEDPKHWDDEPFDAIVSNPPYSKPWAGKTNPILINDPRFSQAGILAPTSKGDLAFTMHMLSWLSEKGTAAIVEFPGILYRGGAEQKIRKYLVENNFVEAVIQLPSDLFFGTGIATCILVLKRSKIDNSVLFVDASDEFTKGDSKNKLTDKNIENIVDLLRIRANQEYKSILISNEYIIKNDCNLSVSAYLSQKKSEEQIDIKAVNKNVEEIVRKGNDLRTELDKIVKELEVVYNV